MGKVALFYACPATGASNGTFAALVGGGASNATEARAQITLSVAGTLTKYAINNTSGGTTSHTARTRKNGADATLLVTQTSAAAGFGEDTSNSDSFSAGDEAGHGFVDSGSDPQYSYNRTIFEASSGHATFLFCSRAAGSVCDQTSDRFIAFAGCIATDGGSTEASEQSVVRVAGVASHFQVGASANVGVSSRILRFRKNAASGNGLVTFLAGATGIAIDAVNTDTLAQDDKINSYIVPLLGTDDITLFSNGCVFTATSGTKTDLYCRGGATGGGVGRTGSATENFTGLGGSMVNLTGTVAAERQVRMGYTGRFSDPRTNISANTCPSDVTVRLRNDTTAQEITITITATTTGLFSNYGTTLDFSPSDDIFVGWVGGTSDLLAVASFEVTIEEVSAAGSIVPIILRQFRERWS